MLARGASWPLHPFLFGAAAVSSLYAANLRETTLGDVGAALGGVLVVALVLLLGLGAPRRLGPRAAILASVVLGWASLCRPRPWLNRYIGAAHPEEIALPWARTAIALALVAVWLVRCSMVLLNTVLNGIAFVLLAVPFGQVGAHAWKSTFDLPASEPSRGDAAGPFLASSGVRVP